MRPAGLPSIASVPAFTHIVHLFEHGKEYLHISAGFCRTGLEAGDCCIWITTPPWSIAIAFHELTHSHMPDARRYVESGQLQFVAYEDWYLAEGQFDAQAILNNAAARIEHAHQGRWSRIRVCGKPCPSGMKMDWASVLQYEQRLQQHMRSHELLLLCAYRAGNLREPVKGALLDVHDDGWHYTPRAPLQTAP
jgi:hypothetical protein